MKAKTMKQLSEGIWKRQIVGFGESSGKTIIFSRRLPTGNSTPKSKSWVAGLIDSLPSGDSMEQPAQALKFSFLGAPLRSGARIQRADIGGNSGTLGLPLVDAEGKLYFLAAGHILSNYWTAQRGRVDRYVAASQTRVLGNVMDCFPVAPVVEDQPLPDFQIDAGIIQAGSGIVSAEETTCHLKVGSVKAVAPGDPVIKCGFATGKTKAEVVHTEVSFLVEHDGGSYFFPRLICLKDPEGSRAKFALPGDSGALILSDEEDHGFVGMLFAADLAEGHYLVIPAADLETYWQTFNLDRWAAQSAPSPVAPSIRPAPHAPDPPTPPAYSPSSPGRAALRTAHS